MAKRKKGGRGRRTVRIAQAASGIMGVALFARPFLGGRTQNAIDALSAGQGNIGLLADGLVQDGKAALTPANIIQAAMPVLVVGVTTKALRALGVRAPGVGRVRAF